MTNEIIVKDIDTLMALISINWSIGSRDLLETRFETKSSAIANTFGKENDYPFKDCNKVVITTNHQKSEESIEN